MCAPAFRNLCEGENASEVERSNYWFLQLSTVFDWKQLSGALRKGLSSLSSHWRWLPLNKIGAVPLSHNFHGLSKKTKMADRLGFGGEEAVVVMLLSIIAQGTKSCYNISGPYLVASWQLLGMSYSCQGGRNKQIT